ncbi:histone-lysine N-methyltransferase, H3 lysine-9 specific SUVH6-like [Daphnia pulicaria]|uniref:histone-lysine N-methyltransferase, H3 lysine-9 specific SUVH6-like n=1 Tax=Daphnia pulicaria TaxID=35523 RepID=UPI001EEA3219|nr:histone-lysine N-methyltransferase, H3 lysine-9 specific SUVH6-like [Daphnia pulicaria]
MPEIPTPNAHNPIKVAIKSDAIRPQYGYRYDGLVYTVEKYWQCVGKSGFKVYKFALRRCPDQPPPPWVSGVVSYANVASSAEEDGEDMDDDDADEQKPTVLKVKLFNK